MKKHICNSANEVKISFFPELLHHENSCCCSVNSNNYIHNTNALLYQKSCCENVFLFVKNTALTVFVSDIQNIRDLLVSDICIFIPKTYHFFVEKLSIKNIYHPPPLILYGRFLLQFIHIIKIPLPDIS